MNAFQAVPEGKTTHSQRSTSKVSRGSFTASMKPTRKFSGFVFLLLLCGFPSLTSAGIRPSFDLEGCSWNATHIVVATEGKTIDGVFRVLESWRGDLKVGDTITIPELASFGPPSARTVSDFWFEKPKSGPRTVVTGDRMILFLKQDSSESIPENGDNVTPSSMSIQWKSASFYREWNSSVAWLDEGKSYAFIQVINPGPSLLVPLSKSEDDLKNRALEVKAAQDALADAAAIVDPVARAEALAPFTHHELYWAQSAAFEALEKTGKPALPTLRKMLADDSRLDIHDQTVSVIALVGQGEVGPDLTGVVQKSLEFWSLTAPGLKKGWWNGEGFDSLDDAEPLRDRYMEVYRALIVLRERPYRESEKVVTQFRDFWRSMPQLVEVGSDSMTKACDDILRELDRIKSRVNAIQFEGLRVFNDSYLFKVLREQGIITDDLPLSPEEIEQAQTALKKLMADQGYTHATVVARDEQSNPNLRNLTFVVNEGEPSRIAEIRFVGNKVFSSSELTDKMRQCWAGQNEDPERIYDAEEFGICLRRLDNFVRSKGYLQASFHDPERSESKAGLVMTVHADENRLFRLGEIKIDGAKSIPAERVRAMLSLRPGEAADGETIARWLFEDLKTAYGELGYIEYIAEPEPEFRAAADVANEGIVDFKVTIEEGQQFRVRTIKFEGRNLPKDLRSHLRLQAGNVYSPRLFAEGIEELNRLGLFEEVDKDSDVKFTTDEEAGLVDLVIKLEPRADNIEVKEPPTPRRH